MREEDNKYQFSEKRTYNSLTGVYLSWAIVGSFLISIILLVFSELQFAELANFAYFFESVGMVFLFRKVMIRANNIVMDSALRLWGLEIVSGFSLAVGSMLLLCTMLMWNQVALYTGILTVHCSLIILMVFLGAELVVVSGLLLYKSRVTSRILMYGRN